jgi:hypothetical protein
VARCYTILFCGYLASACLRGRTTDHTPRFKDGTSRRVTPLAGGLLRALGWHPGSTVSNVRAVSSQVARTLPFMYAPQSPINCPQRSWPCVPTVPERSGRDSQARPARRAGDNARVSAHRRSF